MILACPEDGYVLDIGAWDELSIDLKTGDSIFLWKRCAASMTSRKGPHWVRVVWHGKTPTITVERIASIPPKEGSMVQSVPSSPERRRVPPLSIRKRA